MKVVVFVKATASSEAGVLPSEQLLHDMGEFNTALVEAGIMEVGEGLKPSSEGVRVRFSGDQRTITKGPFIETNELVAGYWVWEVDSMEHAIEWAKKCPNPMTEDSDLEIRPVYTIEDFAEIDPDGSAREHETQLRRVIAGRQYACNPYLFFNGQCDDALAYYQTHLGAEVDSLFRFNQSPDPVPEGILPDGFDDKVMHCQFRIGDIVVMATDHGGDAGTITGFSLTLTIGDEEDAKRVFNALADGGKVIMPLGKTFWSPLYGQVTDKFGVSWMVMMPGEDLQL